MHQATPQAWRAAQAEETLLSADVPCRRLTGGRAIGGFKRFVFGDSRSQAYTPHLDLRFIGRSWCPCRHAPLAGTIAHGRYTSASSLRASASPELAKCGKFAPTTRCAEVACSVRMTRIATRKKCIQAEVEPESSKDSRMAASLTNKVARYKFTAPPPKQAEFQIHSLSIDRY